jgi:hypothetical protein
MSASTATRASAPSPTGAAIKPLAILEAKRFARHPLFLVGVALLALSTATELFADPVNVALMGQPIIPAMTLGIFGLIVAARLTQSSQRSLDSLGAHPVPERTRSAALALACLVPAAVALVWTTFMLTYFWANPPVPAAWWFDTLPAADIISFYLAGAVVAAYGGSVLGVVLGRWVRWSGAPLIAAVLLVVVTIPGSGLVEAFRPYRQIMPWTTWYGGDNGAGADLYYEGNPRWWLVYTICLCILGVIAALLHDRDLPRRRLLMVGAALGAVALAASIAAMTTGPQETRISPPVLHPEQVT